MTTPFVYNTIPDTLQRCSSNTKRRKQAARPSPPPPPPTTAPPLATTPVSQHTATTPSPTHPTPHILSCLCSPPQHHQPLRRQPNPTHRRRPPTHLFRSLRSPRGPLHHPEVLACLPGHSRRFPRRLSGTPPYAIVGVHLLHGLLGAAGGVLRLPGELELPLDSPVVSAGGGNCRKACGVYIGVLVCVCVLWRVPVWGIGKAPPRW